MRLRRRILALSDTNEVVIVIAMAFGYFAIEAALRLLQLDGAPVFVTLPLRYVMVCQVVLLIVIWTFLTARGWSPKDLGERPRIIDVFLGIPLAVAGYLPFPVLWWLLMSQAPDITDGSPTSLDLSGLDFKTIVAGAFVNSVFEEVLVVGYLMTALRKRFSDGAALHASVLIRVSYHLHLGSAAVLFILPLGYVFGYWYSRRRSLLPLVAAHTILDVIAFSLYRVA